MDETPVQDQRLQRLLRFGQSMLPADRSELLLLCGFVCLFISPSLGWWPEELRKLGAFTASSSPEEFRRLYDFARMWQLEMFAMTLPIRFAGAMTLLTYFFPAQTGTRRLAYWVFLPVSVSLLAISVRLLILFGSRPSVLMSMTSWAWNEIRSAPEIFLRLGPGFHFTLAGLLFVGIAAWRKRGRPLAPEDSLSSVLSLIFKRGARDHFEKQTLRFAWIMIVTPLLLRIAALGFTSAYAVFANAISFWPNWALTAYQLLGEALFSLSFVGVVAWAVGQERPQVLRRCIQVPRLRDFALAAFFPVAIACLFPFLSYLKDRIEWAALQWGKYAPPSVASYLQFPGIGSLWAIFPAFAEEIAWRGYLQPRFIELYGLARGVVFTGIVWGAFHFAFDFGATRSDQSVVYLLGVRMAMVIGLSTVLAWITLRSGSVLPAAVLHGAYNILLGVGIPLPFAPWSGFAIWLFVGLALFRYWPPRVFGASGPSSQLTAETQLESTPEG